MNTKKKQFKDPVHGYISVREDWCRDFIDTPIFQRLRYIEQTSMRPLYPAARHDRFIHSLGTFHLGQRVYNSILKNTTDGKLREKLNQKQLKNTFLIACLMHDCGHAPFSHTLEEFFNYADSETTGRAYKLLREEFSNEDFAENFQPSPHEAFSAVLLNRFFADKMKKYNCDPELAARMITGCTHPDESESDFALENRLIALLNGDAIDVDKLDYILRDTWASGVHNTAVDIDRLIASFLFHRDNNGKVEQCFHKSALSVLQNVVDARNYLYEWVYNHHTVLYYSKLLNNSIRKLAKILSKDNDKDHFWKTVFSLESFEKQTQINDKLKIYLPTDGDIIFLLKDFLDDIPEVLEILSHAPERVALWKTYAEFKMLFKEKAVSNPVTGRGISRRLPNLLSKKINCKESDIIIISALAKHYVIEDSHVYILIDNEVKPFTELVSKRTAKASEFFFYVFVSPEYADKKSEIIDLIRSQTR